MCPTGRTMPHRVRWPDTLCGTPAAMSFIGRSEFDTRQSDGEFDGTAAQRRATDGTFCPADATASVGALVRQEAIA